MSDTKYYCIEKNCKNEISFGNWKYGKKRCKSCSKKGKRNGLFKNGFHRKNTVYKCTTTNCSNIVTRGNVACRSCAAKKHKQNCQCCSCCSKRGEYFDINNPSYNGGITKIHLLIRCLKETELWRKQVFERDNYRCQECNKRGGDLEAHHIKGFSMIFSEFLQLYSQFSPIEDKETLVRLAINYEPFWDISNGQTLCVDCHNKTKEKNNARHKI